MTAAQSHRNISQSYVYFTLSNQASVIVINARQSAKRAFDHTERYFEFTPIMTDAKQPVFQTERLNLMSSLSRTEKCDGER